MECTHVCAAQTTCLLLTKQIESGFPSWADEIAEPCPDMNIKVTAFTVTQKLYNTNDFNYNCQLPLDNM